MLQIRVKGGPGSGKKARWQQVGRALAEVLLRVVKSLVHTPFPDHNSHFHVVNRREGGDIMVRETSTSRGSCPHPQKAHFNWFPERAHSSTVLASDTWRPGQTWRPGPQNTSSPKPQPGGTHVREDCRSKKSFSLHPAPPPTTTGTWSGRV